MDSTELPPRFAELKQQIASTYPDFESRATKAWSEILQELEKTTADITKTGSDYIPQVQFADLPSLTPEEIEKIKVKGCVVIRGAVSQAEASAWKKSLQEFVTTNPVDGFPADTKEKQFFELYWTKSQVEARAHPNILKLSCWLNNLYNLKSASTIPENEARALLEGVDLSVPLSYADRFRIRKPGGDWSLPPHVDGGGIERWEDQTFRACFDDILSGNWRNHDPYDLAGRLNARTSMYGRPNQASIFRTFQGWLALSETAPNEGTLQIFPNVLLSNSYNMLRPFFRPTVPAESKEALDPKNWAFDISTPDFPGIVARGGGFLGPRPTPALHPHLHLEDTMLSVPKVYPGDMVFWHCDVIHAVEREHKGNGDSAVMYIPAVPLTPQNKAYIDLQYQAFLNLERPRDYGSPQSERTFVGVGKPEDIVGDVARRAMGLVF